MTSSTMPKAGEPRVIGLVGLGTMGGAMASHLLARGFRVVGYDVALEPLEGFGRRGGERANSVSEVAVAAEIVILSLPTAAAFEEVVRAIAEASKPQRPAAKVVLETSTLPLSVKERGREVLAEQEVTLLDCPISGTGAQMVERDVVFYASGDAQALQFAHPVMAACARRIMDVGVFGSGTRLKVVANLLVAVHNAAAAEALVLARRSGIDPNLALSALVEGAGSSRVLQLRGPMMIARHYHEATMRVDLFQKDLDIIAGVARDAQCPLPVFTAAAQLNLAALAAGHESEDTASVHSVLEGMAGG